MKYILALDQGTTSSRAVVFDENAHIVAMKSYEFEQIYPQPGWVEHDPAAILNTQIDALREAVRISGIPLEAIAAVGITNQPKFILLAVIFSLNVGVTAVVARRKGQQDTVGANRCLRQAVIISLALSILMSLLGAVFARPILLFAGAGPDTIEDAVIYFQILMISIVFMSLSLTINAAQRGAGNTKISMRTNLAANIVNIILNYLLINGIWVFPKWGSQAPRRQLQSVISSAVLCPSCHCFITLIFLTSALRQAGGLTGKQWAHLSLSAAAPWLSRCLCG